MFSLNSFFSNFNFLNINENQNQNSIHESSRFMRVVETSSSFYNSKSERSITKSNTNRALFMNSYNHSFVFFSTDYMRIKKNIDINEFNFSFLNNIANEKRYIIKKFSHYFLFDNTNENNDISRKFCSIFFPGILIKIEIFSRSFSFFSLEEYKQKEKHYQEVSLSFLFDNASKSLALTEYVFKEVSYFKRSMQDLIYQSLIKTPVETPPNEPFIRRGVGRVNVSLFQVDNFKTFKIKYNQQCCFIFLVYFLLEKRHYPNKMATESLIQSLVNNSDENYSRAIYQLSKTLPLDYALIIFIFNIDYIFLSLRCDEMSLPEGNKNESRGRNPY